MLRVDLESAHQSGLPLLFIKWEQDRIFQLGWFFTMAIYIVFVYDTQEHFESLQQLIYNFD